MQRILEVLRDTALFYVKNLKSEKADKHVEYILKRKADKGGFECLPKDIGAGGKPDSIR